MTERTISHESLCPICNKRARDPKARKSPTGHWCMPCQDEFDNIDWDAAL